MDYLDGHQLSTFIKSTCLLGRKKGLTELLSIDVKLHCSCQSPEYLLIPKMVNFANVVIL